MSKTHSQYQEEAHRELGIVMELLEATYPLSKDPKVLVSALHHLKAVHQANSEFVMYLENKENNIDLFLAHAQKKLTKDELDVIKEVDALCTQQQESDVEFRRKDHYVLCNEDYELSTLSKEQLNSYLQHSIALTKKLLG